MAVLWHHGTSLLLVCVVACGAQGSTPSPVVQPVTTSPHEPDAGSAVSDTVHQPPVPGDVAPEWARPFPGRHRATVLGEPPRSARLPPGDYACLFVDDFFKPCTVAKDRYGFTWINMPRSFIGFRGVVYDEGPNIVLDGSSAHERPPGCYRERGFDARWELEPAASRECVEQPIVLRLEDRGGTWFGILTYASYEKRMAPGPPSRSPVLSPMQPIWGWKVRKNKWRVEIAPAARVGERPPKK